MWLMAIGSLSGDCEAIVLHRSGWSQLVRISVATILISAFLLNFPHREKMLAADHYKTRFIEKYFKGYPSKFEWLGYLASD